MLLPRLAAVIRPRPPPQPWAPANPVLRGVRLGTAVEIWLPSDVSRGNAGVKSGSVQEGVVVEVVAPGEPEIRRVDNPRPMRGWRVLATHYVVQCRAACVLRRAAEMDVVCL